MTYTRMETEPMSDGGNESEWIENSKKLAPIHKAFEAALRSKSTISDDVR